MRKIILTSLILAAGLSGAASTTGSTDQRHNASPCSTNVELSVAPLLLRTGTPVVISTGSDSETRWTVADENGTIVLSGSAKGPEMTIGTKELKSGVYRIDATIGTDKRYNRIIVL